MSGDNFAASDKLVCHVEVFKVSIAVLYGYLILELCNLTIIPIVFRVLFGLIAVCIVPSCNIIQDVQKMQIKLCNMVGLHDN